MTRPGPVLLVLLRKVILFFRETTEHKTFTNPETKFINNFKICQTRVNRWYGHLPVPCLVAAECALTKEGGHGKSGAL